MPILLAATARKYKLILVRILAIDTSSSLGSVALIADGHLQTLAPAPGQRYSLELMPCIERLLAGQGQSVRDLDALAVAVGPGAFTGLRVGIGTAQGLALGLGLPCVGVNTFEAWTELHRGEPLLGVTLDALRGEVLAGLFEGGVARRSPRNLAPEAFASEVPPHTLFTGGGVQVHRAAIEAHAASPRFDESPGYLAGAVAEVARRALQAGARGAARDLRPLYLREAYARLP